MTVPQLLARLKKGTLPPALLLLDSQSLGKDRGRLLRRLRNGRVDRLDPFVAQVLGGLSRFLDALLVQRHVQAALDALSAEFTDRFGILPEMVTNLFYQMQIKLRAERAGLISVGMESGQVVLRYPAPPEGADSKPPRLLDLGPGVRGGKNAYWCMFGNEADWQARLLEVLEKLENI